MRRTLVAPILPEPMSRTSPLPGEPRQHEPERDRPEQIAERQSEEHLAGHAQVVANEGVVQHNPPRHSGEGPCVALHQPSFDPGLIRTNAASADWIATHSVLAMT